MKRFVPAGWLAGCLAMVACSSAFANHNPALLEHTSIGQISGSGSSPVEFATASPDATRVIFWTPDALVPADTDSAVDIYQRAAGTTTLLSVGPTGGNGPDNAEFAGSSADASRVFFSTFERLVSADTDNAIDTYERTGGTTTLITAGQINGNGPHEAFLYYVSPDGSRAYFGTEERLVSADSDNFEDVYKREGGTTTRISAGQINGNGSFNAFFDGESADGATVFFTTEERLVPGDNDNDNVDVYARSGGSTTQVSVGQINGNGDFPAFMSHNSADGTKVVFMTDEPLVAADSDTQEDIYLRAGGVTSLVSTGLVDVPGSVGHDVFAATPDASRIIFWSDAQLVPADTDTVLDVYERSGSTTTLVSSGTINGSGDFVAGPVGATPDLAHLYFRTEEQLTPEDTDSAADVYDHSGGVTSLVTPVGQFSHDFAGSSADGSRVFVASVEQLTAADGDNAVDVYEVAGGVLTLITGGPAGSGQSEVGVGAVFVSQDGLRAILTTDDSLLPSDTDQARDLYTAREGPGYPRPKGATPLRVPLVPAYDQCTAPNSTHGPALAFPSCNPPHQVSGHLTIGTPDANGRPTRSSGAVRLDAIVGSPANPADDADLGIGLAVTDVRNAGDLGDYTGELALNWTFRLTDQDNGPGAATVQDVPFGAVASCAATADPNEGAGCSLSTSADAVMPGAIKESRRTIVQDLQGVQVLDGGPDGDADTPAGNTLFLRQGLFVP